MIESILESPRYFGYFVFQNQSVMGNDPRMYVLCVGYADKYILKKKLSYLCIHGAGTSQ